MAYSVVKLMEIVLALVVLGFIIWGLYTDKGLFGTLKEKFAGLLPKVTVGLPETPSGGFRLPGTQQQEISSFVSTVQLMAASTETNCFGTYTQFSDLKGEKQPTQITLRTVGEDMEIAVQNPLGQQQLYTVKKAQPCVIAGDATLVRNFYNYFIRRSEQDKQLSLPYFKQVPELMVTHESHIGYGFSGNVLRVPGLGKRIANDETDNLEDAGILFKATTGICLIPTNKVRYADEDGIDRNFISKDPISLRARLNRGELQRC